MNEYIQKLVLELKSMGFSGKTVKAYMFHVSCFLDHAGTESSKEEIIRYFVGLSERVGSKDCESEDKCSKILLSAGSFEGF